jgi:capsular exopolysaccharide synthesis family protein
MELRQYLEMLRRWAWLLVLGLVVGAGAGFGVSHYQTPIYQASTRILVVRAPQTQGTTDLTYLSDQQLAQTYIELLTTQPVLDAASKQLGVPISKTQVTAQQSPNTQIINLTVEDTSPGRAAQIANQLVQILIAQNDALQTGRYSATEDGLQAQVTQVQAQISTLQSQIDNVSSQAMQDQLTQVTSQITSLKNQVAQLQGDINSSPRPYSGDTQGKAALALKQANLDQLQSVLALYQQVYANLTVMGASANANSTTANSQLSRLQSTLALYQQIYISLLNNLESVKLARLQSTPNVVQIEAATPQPTPIRPRPLTNTMSAGLVGLMLAGGVAFLIEYLDDTIKTSEDVERILGLSVIGYIANMQYPDNSDEGIYVVRQPRSPVSEAFRSLRTNLEFSSVDKPLRSLVVTSANPNEGKTTIAVNLAAIIAQGGKQVILLDADLRKPQVHHFLDLPNRAGLSDLFRDSVSAQQVSQKFAGMEGVSVITSGSLPPNPTELLASARMVQIFQELAETSQMIIVDSPPSLVSDIQVLAAKVDGVLLVIQPGHTQTQDVRAILEQLNRAGARLIGVIFNRIPRDRPYYYGGYRHYSPYYNGGYHYYDGKHDNNTIDVAKHGKGSATNRFSRLFVSSGNGKSGTDKQSADEETSVKG